MDKATKKPRKDEKLLEEAHQRYEDCEDAYGEQYEAALDDLRFARLGEQWDQSVLEQRRREKRPVLTINRLPSFVRQVVNDARLNKPSIKVHPVDSKADPETAEVMSSLIRNIEYTSDAEVAYDTALESAVTCGFGFFRITIDYATDDAFDLDIKIERVPNPLSVRWDAYSTAADASDWSYAFVTETLPKDQFKERYPDAECSDWEADYDEHWLTDDSVRVAEYWKREEVESTLVRLTDGTVMYEDQFEESRDVFDAARLQVVATRPTKRMKVTQYILSPTEILEEHEWPGRYIPIVPVFGDEVFEEGKRHFLSLVRQAKDAQRMYNYWRTTSTELVALAPKAPFIGPRGAFDTDADRWETANTESHAYLEYDGNIPPQRQPFTGPPGGALQESLNAADDMKSIMGIYDASLGARSNETSGRAILARQREGDVGTFHFIDNLSRAIRYAGRVLIDLIPQVYDKPRALRVMGEDDSVENIQVNQPFVSGGIEKMHDLTAGKYDLTVSTGPSFTTQREEAFTQMTEMVRAFPQLAQIAGDLIAKNADWPGADEIAKRLKIMLPKPIQDLDKLDALPPEAQTAVAAAQQQVEQLMQALEQGKQMLGQVQQENAKLKLDNQNKQGELAVKADEVQKSFEANMAKVQAQLAIAANKENEESRRLVVEEAIDALKQRVEGVSLVQAKPFENMDGMLAAMTESRESLVGVSQALAEAAQTLAGTTGKTKTVKIMAPSGAEYTGTVTE